MRFAAVATIRHNPPDKRKWRPKFYARQLNHLCKPSRRFQTRMTSPFLSSFLFHHIRVSFIEKQTYNMKPTDRKPFGSNRPKSRIRMPSKAKIPNSKPQKVEIPNLEPPKILNSELPKAKISNSEFPNAKIPNSKFSKATVSNSNPRKHYEQFQIPKARMSRIVGKNRGQDWAGSGKVVWFGGIEWSLLEGLIAQCLPFQLSKFQIPLLGVQNSEFRFSEIQNSKFQLSKVQNLGFWLFRVQNS